MENTGSTKQHHSFSFSFQGDFIVVKGGRYSDIMIAIIVSHNGKWEMEHYPSEFELFNYQFEKLEEAIKFLNQHPEANA